MLAIEGRLAPLGPQDAYERRRGTHALLLRRAIRATGARRGGLLGALDGVRARTERALTRGMPAPQGALARGMVLGQDGALTDERARGLPRNRSRAPRRGERRERHAARDARARARRRAGLGLSARLWLALALVAAYVPLAGGGPSIQRAAVMGIAGLVAALAGRPASRWYALLLAAALTLAWNPRAAADAGWQLSFAAVVAMLALVPALRARLGAAGVPRGLAEALAVTLAATLGTAPLIALHFERVSLVSLPANVLAAPAVAPSCGSGRSPARSGRSRPALAAPVAALAALPLGYLTWLADAAAALPFAEVAVPSPGPPACSRSTRRGAAPCSPGGGWPRAPPARARGAALAAVSAAAALVALAAAARAPPRDLTISFLDIGQGDATLIQHGDAAVLVDTGPPGGAGARAPARRRRAPPGRARR